jgi:hypothetical protein
MATYVCGDSHAKSFQLCADRTHDYGGWTCLVISQFGMPAELRVSAGDNVIFCFGEVDVRVHLPKLAEQRGVGIDAIITEVITGYVNRIREYCGTRGVHAHVIAAPPQAVPTTLDAIVPTVDAIEDRNARTVKVNELLASLCPPDIVLIDPWHTFRNPDGSLNMAHKPSALWLSGTDIYYDNIHVGVLTGPAGAYDGTLRECVAEVLDHAREDMIDEADHNDQIRAIEDAHGGEIAELESENRQLEDDVAKLEGRVAELEALLADVEIDGAAGVLAAVQARLDNEKKVSDGLLKAVRERDATIAKLKKAAVRERDAAIAKLKKAAK